ncbi:AAA family ATPase, partial [Streptomyces sp. P17]|uniref:AAA family ATPase n=1 Tax=Streptomyces sp. P17 TaxID=3074716 RepID=UPI0028F44A17
AARIGLRMLAVRPDRLIEKYLGSTGRNIGALFDAVAPYKEGDSFVLFLDEFDAVAITRKEAERSAAEERNAWVNTLLQRIEQHDG